MASILQSLNAEWSALAGTPAARRAVKRWTMAHPVFAPAEHLDDVLEFGHCPKQGPEVHRALAALATTRARRADTAPSIARWAEQSCLPHRPRRRRDRRDGEPRLGAQHLPRAPAGIGVGQRLARRPQALPPDTRHGNPVRHRGTPRGARAVSRGSSSTARCSPCHLAQRRRIPTTAAGGRGIGGKTRACPTSAFAPRATSISSARFSACMARICCR